MRFIDRRLFELGVFDRLSFDRLAFDRQAVDRRAFDRSLRSSLAGLVVLAGCSAPSPPAPPSSPSSPTPSSRSPSASPGAESVARPGIPPVAPQPGVPAEAARLPPPGAVRSWAQVREQAAQRIVAANPALTYTGAVPEPLLAIPVLEIELHGDGSVRKIEVLRQPGQARDTVSIAIEAVHRAAPFGDVSRLPKPWRFTETFLFDDARRFKPRTLDR